MEISVHRSMAQVVGFEVTGNPMDNGDKLLRMLEIGCSATRTYTSGFGTWMRMMTSAQLRGNTDTRTQLMDILSIN